MKNRQQLAWQLSGLGIRRRVTQIIGPLLSGLVWHTGC